MDADAQEATKADKYEKNRMAKEPFQTMVAPDSPETLEHLRGWLPPQNAFVLLEAHITHVRAQGFTEPGTRLMTLNVEARPEQREKLDYYIGKGYKPIHYGRFPGLQDKSPKRMRIAQMYGGENGENPWASLAHHLGVHMKRGNAEAELAKERSRADALMQRIAEFEAKEVLKAAPTSTTPISTAPSDTSAGQPTLSTKKATKNGVHQES